ncbi:hypothetical protein FB446DRAFT_790760 [Lentinula raphanica]|nr:hypothetical protein FB446DRAFT_790760 [Lentinula raphanica]
MSRPPQEIIDRIVDEFHGSFADLKALSLVARPWLHRTRYHLFRSLTLAPRDLQAIRDNYTDAKRRASLKLIVDPDDYLTSGEEQLIRSPLAENPQPTHYFLSSIAHALHHVRGVRLVSHVRLGGRAVPMMEYFHDWLGFGGDEYALHCRVRYISSSDEDFRERQKALGVFSDGRHLQTEDSWVWQTWAIRPVIS